MEFINFVGINALIGVVVRTLLLGNSVMYGKKYLVQANVNRLAS